MHRNVTSYLCLLTCAASISLVGALAISLAQREKAFALENSSWRIEKVVAWSNYGAYWDLPPAGTCDANRNELFSWRLELSGRSIPSQVRLRKKERWDSLHNIQLEGIGVYAVAIAKDGPPRIVTVLGDDTGFRRNERTIVDRLPNNLILFLETEKERGHWMAPSDLHLDGLMEHPKAAMERFVGRPCCKRGFNVGFASGEVWFLRSDIPVENLLPFFTRTGAVSTNREDRLSRFVISRGQGSVEEGGRLIPY